MACYKFLAAGLLSFLLWLILLPVFAPVFLAFWCYRVLVILTMKIIRPDLKILSSEDAGLVDDIRRGTLYNIGFVVILGEGRGEISRIKLCDLLRDHLLLGHDSPGGNGRSSTTRWRGHGRGSYWKLRKFYKSHCGYYFWEEPRTGFCLDDHVTEHEIRNQSELSFFVSKWIKSPFGKDRPMWEAALIRWDVNDPGVDKGAVAVAFRIHHALGDGISVLKILNKFFGVHPQDVKSDRRRGSLMTKKICLTLILPLLILKFIQKLMKSPSPFAGQKTQDQSFLTFTTVPLANVKSIKNSVGTPFGTVLMALVAGVFRRLLLDSGHENLPESVCLANALPWPHRDEEELRNSWTFGMFTTPIREQDPVRRIQEISADLKEYLEEGAHLVIKPFLFSLTSLIPFGFVHKFTTVKDEVAMAPSPIMTGGLAGVQGRDFRMLDRPVLSVFPVACNADPHIGESFRSDFTIVSQVSSLSKGS